MITISRVASPTNRKPADLHEGRNGLGWESFPEYLDNLERGKLGVNAASFIHYSPLRACAMDNDAASDPKYKATRFNVRAIPARDCGTYT